nr:hypothetical protein [Tessaracoccus flavescens]
MEERATAGVPLIVLAQTLLDVSQPSADAVLMPLERGQVDGVSEVRGKQLVALGFEPCPVRGEVGELLIASHAPLVERGVDLGGEVAVVVFTDRDAGVGVLDQPLRNLHGHRPSSAVGLLRCSARADDVGVARATRVGREVEQHPRPAGAAVQQAFEVVGVLDVPGHLRRPRPQERLHRVEQRRFHDGFVRAGVERALVADHPGVVRVRQHPIEGVLAQRPGWALRRRHRQQSARGQVAQQCRHRDLAGGVTLERPPDQRCALGIDLDRAYLATSVVGSAHVQVADGCASGGAALGDLLRQPLRDFGGQVPTVELRNARHDAVDEHPRRRLVDALGGGDEGDSGADEGFVDLHVVGAVAGEPVEFMDDAELHPRRGDERQHVLQPVTIRRACGLTGVDELPHDPHPEFVGLPRVRLALGGDGESLVGAATFGLLARGDAKVGHPEQHGCRGGGIQRRGTDGGGGAHCGPPCESDA